MFSYFSAQLKYIIFYMFIYMMLRCYYCPGDRLVKALNCSARVGSSPMPFYFYSCCDLTTEKFLSSIPHGLQPFSKPWKYVT